MSAVGCRNTLRLPCWEAVCSREDLHGVSELCCSVPGPQQQHEDLSAKKLRLTKPSKSAALHVDLCKATSPADALQYLLQFARKPVEVESVEGVVRILLEHYYKVMKLGATHAARNPILALLSWDGVGGGMGSCCFLCCCLSCQQCYMRRVSGCSPLPTWLQLVSLGVSSFRTQ